MTRACPIDQAADDPMLLGAALGATPAGLPASWTPWKVVLKAAHGRSLTPAEAEIFAGLAGGRSVPDSRVAELWVAAGRRSGKSRIAALLACHAAALVDHREKLAPGETGYVLVLSPTVKQARQVRAYVEAFLRASPILRQQLDGEPTTEEIRLKPGVVIAAHPANYRSVRSRTLVAAILDEVAFFRDEESANPDVEVYRAVLPALSTTDGLLIGISSPYRKVGLLYQKHRDHFGQDGDVLVIQAPTEVLNPTIDRRKIEAARRSDPEAARAEWEGQFRAGLSSLLDDAVIDAAVDHDRPLELPPQPGVPYFAFSDASAGRHDHFTICIGHREGERFVADVIRGAKPPFDPARVAAEYAALAKAYGCRRLVGDNFAGEWVAGAFKAAGIAYMRSPKSRSELYLESLPYWMRGLISIPNHSRLIRELRLLERHVAPSGRDRVDHGRGGSDDYANALAGALSVEPVRRPETRTYDIVEGGKLRPHRTETRLVAERGANGALLLRSVPVERLRGSVLKGLI